MADDASPHNRLITKIEGLPAEHLLQVEAFVDQLEEQGRDRVLVLGALAGSQPAFAAVWDNDDDAIYDEL